jgi:hypothetical protein
VHVDDSQIAHSRPGSQALKYEFLGAWDIAQSEVLSRRTDKNQVVVLHVIQGKQAAALYPQRFVQQFEDMVELVDRQDFSHAGVVVEDGCRESVAGLKYRKPVSGRPTNAPLLKMSQGSGPEVNFSQNVRTAAGTASAEAVEPGDRAATSIPITIIARNNSPPSAGTIQFRRDTEALLIG